MISTPRAAYAKGSGKADTSRLGVTGFSWGGRIVWMYAAHNSNLKAALAWYGPLDRSYYPGDKTALDVVKDLKAPVLGLYGGADQGGGRWLEAPAILVRRVRSGLTPIEDAGVPLLPSHSSTQAGLPPGLAMRPRR